MHIVITPIGLQTPLAPWVLSLAPSFGGPVSNPIDNCDHPLLNLPGTGIASQETAISGSFQENLAGICNSVCVWWLIMGWIPRWGNLWMVHPFILASNFVSVTPFMGILFPILRRNEVSTHWSSFLIFLCFGCCILGILGFWANYPLISECISSDFFCDWVTLLRMISSRYIHNAGGNRKIKDLIVLMYPFYFNESR